MHTIIMDTLYNALKAAMDYVEAQEGRSDDDDVIVDQCRDAIALYESENS